MSPIYLQYIQYIQYILLLDDIFGSIFVIFAMLNFFLPPYHPVNLWQQSAKWSQVRVHGLKVGHIFEKLR